jgi:K+-transporting ATPase ATPase C chain
MPNTNPPIPSKSSNDSSGGSLLGHLWASIAATIVLGIICSGIYPAVVWGFGQVLFSHQANGSLLKKDGSFHPRPSAAGSGYDSTSSGGSNLGPLSDKLINGVTTPATTQPTVQPESLAFDGVRLRAIHYAVDNGIPFKLYNVAADDTRSEVPLKNYLNKDGSLNDIALVDAFPHSGATAGLIAADFGTLIPGDAVTASASGLDPHISPANAEMQKSRIASARNIKPEMVDALINDHTDQPALGIIGDPGVNVLMLNLALDAKYPVPTPPATK